MCGIATIHRYRRSASTVEEGEINAIRDAMANRGPDGSGTWVSPDRSIALAHRRLAIIGLGDQGRQPMALTTRCTGGDGDLVVTYNGEIYNHVELRSRLSDLGHRFRSTCDTEVLLHLYEEYAEDMVDHLRGMFAFTLWDGQRRHLLLARDPLGIKPLYVADDGSTLRVASQAKALIAGGGVSAEPSNAGVAGFFLFGSVPEPLTAWDAITAIPAGATVIVSEGGVGQPRLHGSIADFWRDGQRASATGADAGALIRSALADSVRAHLVADVEVGVFLSAGVDSGALLGLGSELGGPMAAVTLGFEEYQGHATDETPLARTVAEHYGARHAVDLIGRSDFRRWLPEILHAMDQPSIDGVNTWMVSRKAAEAGLKVIQSGIGGDELLAGYGSFSSVPKWARRLRPFGVVPGLGRTSRRGFQHLPFLASRPKLPGLLEYGGSLQNLWFLQRALFLPWELPELLGPERSEDGLRQLDLDSLLQGATEPDPGSDLKRIASLEGSIYMRNQLLRDADWAGMAHSLEIRVPFVDVELIRQVGPLLNDDRPPGELKRLAGNAPARPLPSAVLNRSKSNFNVPVGQWAVDLGGYDSWRRVPMLRDDRTPWARRWAYLVADSLGLLLAT